MQAQLEISDYDILNQTLITPQCFVGTVIQSQYSDNIVSLVAYSSKKLLSKIITRSYQSHCQALWGDTRCKIDKEAFKQTIQITQIEDKKITYDLLSAPLTAFFNPYITDNLGNRSSPKFG